MVTKSELIKSITHNAWKTLGTGPRGKIAEEYARIVIRSTYSKDRKVELFAAISRIGWALKALEIEGYGYNTANGGKHKDSAGKLNSENKGAVWVYTN